MYRWFHTGRNDHCKFNKKRQVASVLLGYDKFDYISLILLEGFMAK